MNEEQKKQYLEKYHHKKQKGEKFWPDQIYTDLVASFMVFILLVGLAAFVGVAQEPRVDPSDTTYVPSPEWYFLSLYQMLKFFPGELEWVGTVIIPGAAVGILFLLPFLDRSPYRHFRKRWLANGVMAVVVLVIVFFTVWGDIDVKAKWSELEAEGLTEEIIANSLGEEVVLGEELYGLYCVECHGTEGEGGEIKGVEGLEGKVLPPLNSIDVMYTFTDETLANIISYGQPDQGMPPYAKQFGGELSPAQVRYVATFMRYTWDDRAELPEPPKSTGPAPLAEGEVPSYEAHIQPLVKRYCVSCHRPGKENHNYLMQTYDEVLKSGDNADKNVIPGNAAASHLVRMLNHEDLGDFGGPMPPTRQIKPEYIDMFVRWIDGGVPLTPADAAAAGGGTTPTSSPETTPEPTTTP
jgi:mono/diheme cytochrome c family protein